MHEPDVDLARDFPALFGSNKPPTLRRTTITRDGLALARGARDLMALNPAAFPSAGTPRFDAIQHDSGHVVATLLACPPVELEETFATSHPSELLEIRFRRVVPFTVDWLPGFAVHCYAGAIAQYPDAPRDLSHAPGSCGAPGECGDEWCGPIEKASRYDRHGLELAGRPFGAYLPAETWQPQAWEAAWDLIHEHFDAVERVRDAQLSERRIPWQRVRELVGVEGTAWPEPAAPRSDDAAQG